MVQPPTWDVSGGPLPERRRLQVLADALTDVAAAEVRAGVPAFWEAPWVVYRREPPGSERWSSPSRVLRRGHGDCEDLAAWLAGSIRARHGVAARALVVPMGRGYHVVVALPDGTRLDPSRERGMR